MIELLSRLSKQLVESRDEYFVSERYVINFWTHAIEILDRDGIVAVVSIIKADGSTPRNVGTRMAVAKDSGIVGTIGGGAFEFAVLNDAVNLMFEKGCNSRERDWPLGPDLGQCCGGRVRTLTQIFEAKDRQLLVERSLREVDADRTNVLLFGAGHVGRAIVLAMAPLPFNLQWVDSRADAFPPLIVQTARAIISNAPAEEINQTSDDTFVLIMTHSHALDFEIVDAALKKSSLAYVGLIGSETKRTRFERRLRALGHTDQDIGRLHCPIGISGISGKEPAVIAASVAVDLLVRQEGLRNRSEKASFWHGVPEILK